ncbi:PH domain-containing protein [Flavobacteriaceae bacterium MAR_2010_188]|nr:PH domain-containing protein [Flavobacteriaceae bacterium MAR_2010_188]
MTKRYPSKVSFGILAFIFLVSYGPICFDLINNDLPENLNTLLLILTVVFAFVLYLFFNTHYTIKEKKLFIKCGFFNYKPIDILEITEISKTNNLISSPAPSLDRIEIKYGKSKNIVISPKDKQHFAKDLCKINPAIKNDLNGIH